MQYQNGNSAIFQQYHGENKLIFNEMMMMNEVCFVLDKHAEIDFIVKQQSADTRTHYSDSEPTNLWSFSLLLRA
jgi:hypothetical protein